MNLTVEAMINQMALWGWEVDLVTSFIDSGYCPSICARRDGICLIPTGTWKNGVRESTARRVYPNLKYRPIQPDDFIEPDQYLGLFNFIRELQ